MGIFLAIPSGLEFVFAARRSGGERKGAVWSPGKTNRGKLEAGDEAWHCGDVFCSCRLGGWSPALRDSSDFCCSRLGRSMNAEMRWGLFVCLFFGSVAWS